jgi:hypothetical protein
VGWFLAVPLSRSLKVETAVSDVIQFSFEEIYVFCSFAWVSVVVRVCVCVYVVLCQTIHLSPPDAHTRVPGLSAVHVELFSFNKYSAGTFSSRLVFFPLSPLA